MSTQEVRQISTTELPTWLREYQEDILARAQGLARDPLARPAYQIADLTPQQLQASQLAIGGVGSYFPMLQAGVETTGLGVGSLAEGYNQQLNAAPWLQQAGSAVNDAIGGNLGYRNEAADMFRNALPQITDSTQDALRRLRGTGARFNPEDITPFMNHYEDAAVQQALKDIDRSGQIAQRGLRQRATGMGAFGGSRAQIAESELSRNTLLQQGRTAAQRLPGFQAQAEWEVVDYERSKAIIGGQVSTLRAALRELAGREVIHGRGQGVSQGHFKLPRANS